MQKEVMMQLQNKNKIAYLTSLTLLFSYIELFIPRFLPFFRIGLGNIPVLLALDLCFPEIMLLSVLKAICSSVLNGTLISPFFLVSFGQSICSALIMWGFYKIRGKWISLYGISMLGSAVSAFIQILISSLYLGNNTFSLLGLMLVFSLASGIITAALALHLQFPKEAPTCPQETSNTSRWFYLAAILIFAATVICFIINNIFILAAALIISFTIQICSGRKLLILPHLSIWIFIILISLLSPEGQTLFKVFNFPITQKALFTGITKALKLSIAASLSQCLAAIKFSGNNLAGLSLIYFRSLSNYYRNQKGNVFVKLQKTLSATEL